MTGKTLSGEMSCMKTGLVLLCVTLVYDSIAEEPCPSFSAVGVKGIGGLATSCAHS